MSVATAQLRFIGPVRQRSVRHVRRARTLRVLAVLLVATAVLVFAPRAVQTMAHSETAPWQSYAVAPGDTLWDLAAKHSTGRDLRVVVADIKRVNHLKTAEISSGQRLLIPR